MFPLYTTLEHILTNDQHSRHERFYCNHISHSMPPVILKCWTPAKTAAGVQAGSAMSDRCSLKTKKSVFLEMKIYSRRRPPTGRGRQRPGRGCAPAATGLDAVRPSSRGDSVRTTLLTWRQRPRQALGRRPPSLGPPDSSARHRRRRRHRA